MTKKCKYCGSTENLRQGIRLGVIFYYPVCISCIKLDIETKLKKRKQTNLKKYGVENVAQIKDIQVKMQKTNLKKYGATNPSKNQQIIEKRKQTNLQRYGETAPSKNKQVQDKIKKTNIEKYGVDNPLKNKTIKQKATNTIKEKYGVDNIFKSEEFKESQRQLIEDQYGVSYFTQTDIMKNKSKKTRKARYGFEYHSQVPSIKLKMWKTYRINYWNTFLLVLKNRYIIPKFSKEDYINRFDINNFKYHCERCNKEFVTDVINPHRIICGCAASRSYYEDEIIVWLQSLNLEKIIPNERYYEDSKLKYEIDIFLPDYNLGIEFCGLYWHSDVYRDKTYHQEKYLYFKEKGIQLIQIFENEWLNKQKIVKSVISSKLGICKRIAGRSCIIKEVSNREAVLFFEANHLQGKINSKYNIGLFYNNELIHITSFSKYRYKQEDAYEIIRSASILNTIIIGGFAKVLNYFIKNYSPNKIISFVDLRYFSGSSYYKVQFNLDSTTKPNYFYYKDKDKSYTLHSRIKFQKHKLITKLSNFNAELSEYQNMTNNGYFRIFDAGNLKMLWKK